MFVNINELISSRDSLWWTPDDEDWENPSLCCALVFRTNRRKVPCVSRWHGYDYVFVVRINTNSDSLVPYIHRIKLSKICSVLRSEPLDSECVCVCVPAVFNQITHTHRQRRAFQLFNLNAKQSNIWCRTVARSFSAVTLFQCVCVCVGL